MKRESGWYWVRKKGWFEEYGEWTPAFWNPDVECWYSYSFGGIPDRQMIVGPMLEPPDFNQSEFDELVSKGTKSWADVQDATEFVEDLRGNE